MILEIKSTIPNVFTLGLEVMSVHFIYNFKRLWCINRKRDKKGIGIQGKGQKLGDVVRIRHTKARHDVESSAADEGLGALS